MNGVNESGSGCRSHVAHKTGFVNSHVPALWVSLHARGLMMGEVAACLVPGEGPDGTFEFSQKDSEESWGSQ